MQNAPACSEGLQGVLLLCSQNVGQAETATSRGKGKCRRNVTRLQHVGQGRDKIRQEGRE